MSSNMCYLCLRYKEAARLRFATGVDKKFWAMGHVFATGFRPNYFSRSACGARPVSVERETNLQSASCVARRF